MGDAGVLWFAPLIMLLQPPAQPLMRVVDLGRGEAVNVTLANGDHARVELLEHSEVRDTVRAGQELTFLVRTCRTTYGQETWDFGDGSGLVTVRSDGCAEEKARAGYARTRHTFTKPGDYLVKVERANHRGEKATAHLWVPVRE